MERNTDLRKEIYRRALQEYDTFIERLKEQPIERILTQAQEIAVKTDILEMLEHISDNRELKGLQNVKTPLAVIYKEWQEKEGGYLDYLRRSIRDSSDKILRIQAEKFYRRPEAPLYRKDLQEAREAGEVHLRLGDFQRSKQCLKYFSEGASLHYEPESFPSFLKDWVKEFGFERCKTVLAMIVQQQATHDKRYSRFTIDNAVAVERPNKAYEDLHTHVHPVIINLAYQKLMEMERGVDISKGKSGGNPQKTDSRKQAEPER